MTRTMGLASVARTLLPVVSPRNSLPCDPASSAPLQLGQPRSRCLASALTLRSHRSRTTLAPLSPCPLRSLGASVLPSQADDRELVERLCSFQDELLLSARIGAPSPQPHHRGGSVSIDGGGQSARPSGEPSGEGAETGARGGGGGATADGSVETAAESARLDGSPKRKMSAASLSAALELTDLESAQQRFGGGAFLPILPLGSDIDSIDRGLPTLHTTTSTTRWATSC